MTRSSNWHLSSPSCRPRELAGRFTDEKGHFVSGACVCRLLKATRSRGGASMVDADTQPLLGGPLRHEGGHHEVLQCTTPVPSNSVISSALGCPWIPLDPNSRSRLLTYTELPSMRLRITASRPKSVVQDASAST